MARYDNYIEQFDAELMSSTDRAWLFVIEEKEVWVPKSIGEWTPSTTDGVVGVVEVPTWFAVKNQLA